MYHVHVYVSLGFLGYYIQPTGDDVHEDCLQVFTRDLYYLTACFNLLIGYRRSGSVEITGLPAASTTQAYLMLVWECVRYSRGYSRGKYRLLENVRKDEIPNNIIVRNEIFAMISLPVLSIQYKQT